MLYWWLVEDAPLGAARKLGVTDWPKLRSIF